jgi:hypothetical protein
MPAGVKFAVFGGLALLIGGAAWLMIARGPAILLDLAGAAAACF